MRRFWTIFSVVMILVFVVTGFLLSANYLTSIGLIGFGGQSTPTVGVIGTPTASAIPTQGPPTATVGPGTPTVEPATPTVVPTATPTLSAGPPPDSSNPFGLPTPVIAGLFVISSISTLISAGRGMWRIGLAIGRRLKR